MSRVLGQDGEQVAAAHLKSLGYRIVHRNFTSKFGELDLVAKDPQFGWVYVEVKSYKPQSFLDPLEAITKSKIKKLLKTVQYYQLCHRNAEDAARFDVIVVAGDRVKEHLMGAITL